MSSWNKGLTKETSSIIKRIANKKSDWWKTHDTTETRRKIGDRTRGIKIAPEKSGGWKGGRLVSKRDGYVYIHTPNHPMATTKKYVLEHRLVMEKIIGRYLTKKEDVHHKNGIKDDNRPENLMLISHNHHYQVIQCPKCNFEFHIQ